MLFYRKAIWASSAPWNESYHWKAYFGHCQASSVPPIKLFFCIISIPYMLLLINVRLLFTVAYMLNIRNIIKRRNYIGCVFTSLRNEQYDRTMRWWSSNLGQGLLQYYKLLLVITTFILYPLPTCLIRFLDSFTPPPQIPPPTN